MKKHILVAGAAMLALGFTASLASAVDCSTILPGKHPAKAGSLKSSLVQAYVSCGNVGGNTPNFATAGGVPGCNPPQSFHEKGGSPAGGWTWGAGSKGDVAFKASKNKGTGPLNPPGTSDLSVTLKMSGIEDNTGLATGAGTLASVARATLNDPAGLLTVIDFPAGFPIQATGGKVSLKTSANVLLNGLGLPALGTCSTIEVVAVLVNDPNGNSFANMGTYLNK